MRESFLIFGSPAVEQPEIDEVEKVLQSGWLGTGPKVEAFEKAFSNYKGGRFAIAVNSCTAALHLSMLGVGLKPGDEVITTALTFCATVNAICHAGAIPVLVDVDRDTMNIDPLKIEEKITSKTKAIVPVHFAGRPCEMDLLIELAQKYNLKIIEDCAHAVESMYKGQHTGTFGDFGCFSFYVTKNVVTGEGGMILTGNKKDGSRVKTLALHGLSSDAWKRFSDDGYQHYFVHEIGYKYNMMDIQAAIGIHQLSRVDKNWQRRKEIWENYNKAFIGLPLTVPADSADHIKHGYHLYTILLDEVNAGMSRDHFLQEMTKLQIGVGVHYVSIPEHPYYRETYGWDPENYPNAWAIGRQTISLPLSAKLSDADVEDVIMAVNTILR